MKKNVIIIVLSLVIAVVSYLLGWSNASLRDFEAREARGRLGINLAKGQERDPGVQCVSGFATAPLLGQSLLGAGILRGHGGVGPRDDTEVCKMAGEAGTTSRGVPIQPRMNKPGQRAVPSPLRGLGFGLLWRPEAKAPPFGRGLFTLRHLASPGRIIAP
jgi:hypothetical protein